jgi:23S rRNA (guanosine2251-2'-O)-methyltransferase
MSEKDIIYGKNAVEALLESQIQRVNKVFIVKGIKFDGKIGKILKNARDNGIVVQEVPREKLNTLCDGVHQGIAASVSPVDYVELEDLLEQISSKEGFKTLIILDGVEDPHNLGAIIRTAVCAGMDGVIIPKRRATPVTGIVEKTSAGAIEKIRVCQVNNLNRTIEILKENNFWIVGAESRVDKRYYELDYNMNCAVIFGGENQGISNLVRKNCDFLIDIPIVGDFNSLNVSNAAGIIIYEIVRQRMQK